MRTLHKKSLCLLLSALFLLVLIPCSSFAEGETRVVILATSDLHGNIFDIYKFDNTLSTLNVTGKELKGYMEWAAACYNQWVPGDINISFEPDHPGYLYDMFAGVDYEINLSKPAGERIEDVMFRGEPLQDDQILKLAVNNYRYSSGIKAQGLAEGKRDWESSNSIRDMIVDYFAANSPVSPTVNNNWRITGVDLSEGDPRRAEIIGYINDGLLPTPYNKSYNLANYDALVAEAEANQAAGSSAEEHESHLSTKHPGNAVPGQVSPCAARQTSCGAGGDSQ